MINYKVSKCKNPGKNAVEGTTYYSCKASKTSDYTFKELAQDIAYSTTCTKADALSLQREHTIPAGRERYFCRDSEAKSL